MVQYRIQVSGVDAPDCIRAITTIDAAVIEPVSEPRTLRLRCGVTLGVFSVVPSSTTTCPDPDTPVETTITVDIAGVGTGTATVSLPGEAYCPPLRG